MAHVTGCFICGNPLSYSRTAEERVCALCGASYRSEARCIEGHFVCDTCHSLRGNDRIEQICLGTMLSDPVALANLIMSQPGVAMHGPEHHFLVPAVLLTALYNLRTEPELKAAKLRQARKRAESVVGGACGFLGNCGAGVGTGIFISLFTDATPVSRGEWRLSNLMTAESLAAIARHGGPRCCKRDTFLALQSAGAFLRRELGVDLRMSEEIICGFSDLNAECLLSECPFHPEKSAP